jgi:hypothetical protein
VHISIFPHTRHMPCPSHSSRFYYPHNINGRSLHGVKSYKTVIANLSICCIFNFANSTNIRKLIFTLLPSVQYCLPLW